MTDVVAPSAIQRLSQVVADAIAAGEVVERPASVVKELCENALDAGATQIDVDIQGGGLVRIAVSDDGSGIAADQLPLATARHATSKISGIDDLAAVSTLGFRGEALASISAVADVMITAAVGGATAGASLNVRGGEVIGGGPAPRARGTTVEVRDIFFNTPARLRFLKSERTESAAAVRVVADLAVANPTVAFTCRADGRTVVRAPGGDLAVAAAAIFGGGAARELLDVDSPGDTVHVWGCISEPRAHRGSRNSLVLAVNGRRVHNRALVFAIEEAYRGLIPSGRHPYGVLHLAIDPSHVDVNVHPAKREIRFRDESLVFAAVQRACWHALQGAATYSGAVDWQSSSGYGSVRDTGSLTFGEIPGAPADFGGRSVVANLGEARESGDLSGAEVPNAIADLVGLQSLGQVGSQWLVAATPGRIVLIDPHAAHEKIIYEQILARWRRGRLDPEAGDHVQLLLIPAIIECDAAQMEAFAGASEWLEQCGFVIDEFGPSQLRCSAVPAASANADVTSLVGEVLDGLAKSSGDDGARRHRIAALIACHSAVRFGDTIGDVEQQRLLTQLAVTPNALTCPHGRPTVMVLDDAALRRAFRRPAV